MTLQFKRRDDWPERMNRAIQEHRKLPYWWGQSDCGILFSDVAWAMTDADPMEAFGRWNSEKTALRAVASTGCRSVKEYLDQKLERVPVARARRGDAGYCADVATLTCPAIIIGSEALSRDHTGWIVVDLSKLQTVYKIG